MVLRKSRAEDLLGVLGSVNPQGSSGPNPVARWVRTGWLWPPACAWVPGPPDGRGVFERCVWGDLVFERRKTVGFRMISEFAKPNIYLVRLVFNSLFMVSLFPESPSTSQTYGSLDGSSVLWLFRRVKSLDGASGSWCLPCLGVFGISATRRRQEAYHGIVAKAQE